MSARYAEYFNLLDSEQRLQGDIDSLRGENRNADDFLKTGGKIFISNRQSVFNRPSVLEWAGKILLSRGSLLAAGAVGSAALTLGAVGVPTAVVVVGTITFANWRRSNQIKQKIDELSYVTSRLKTSFTNDNRPAEATREFYMIDPSEQTFEIDKDFETVGSGEIAKEAGESSTDPSGEDDYFELDDFWDDNPFE